MKKEDWEFIANNWGASDESVMNQIATIRDQDTTETAALNSKLTEKDAEIMKLNQQNIDLNKTNMNLILRLTEPGSSVVGNEPEQERKAASIYDLDAFIREV